MVVPRASRTPPSPPLDPNPTRRHNHSVSAEAPGAAPPARAWPQLLTSSAPAPGPNCFLQHSD